jgi:hypothetical protein
MKTDFVNNTRLFAEDLNANFSETDSRLTAAGTDANLLISGTINNERIPVLEHSKMPTGSVLQVVSQEFTTEKTVNTNAYIDTDITLSITPKFSDSRIFSLWNINHEIYRDDDDGEARFKVLRNLSGTDTNLREEVVGFQANAVTLIYDFRVLTLSIYDSPATTNTVTYRLQMACANSTEPRTVTVNNAGFGKSVVTLFEIAG